MSLHSQYVLLRFCNIFQHLEQAVPSPSDGRHACSRRCQLALDLTVRGTGHLTRPLHSPGDCNVVGVVPFLLSNLLLYTFHLVVADRRATARTTNPLSHAASRQKQHLSCEGIAAIAVRPPPGPTRCKSNASISSTRTPTFRLVQSMLIALACVTYLAISASQFLRPAIHTTSELYRIPSLRCSPPVLSLL